MLRITISIVIIFLVSSCSADVTVKLSQAEQLPQKKMPDIFQSITPSQQRSIMSGERPDWSENPALPGLRKK